MKNTTAIGDLSAALVMAALLHAGINVLKPLSDGLRYDLAIEIDGVFSRVQCKTGRLINGIVKFNAYSVSGKQTKSYRGDCDLFGVYCPELDQCYLIPVSDVGQCKGRLRVSPSKNNQAKRVVLAENYHLGGYSSKVEHGVANAGMMGSMSH